MGHVHGYPDQVTPRMPLNGHGRASSLPISPSLVHILNPGKHRGIPHGAGEQLVRSARRDDVRLRAKVFKMGGAGKTDDDGAACSINSI